MTDMTPSERTMKWGKENPERAKALQEASRARIMFNPDRLKRRREASRKYYAKHPEKMRRWREESKWGKVADRCRSLVRNAMYGVACRGVTLEG